MQEQLIDKRIRFYTIDASAVARETGMGGRINTIMQTCFFAISGVLPREEAIAQIKHAIEKTYSKRGAEVVKRNFEAVDATLAHLQEVPVPSRRHRDARAVRRSCPPLAPDFVQRITAVLLAGKGDLLPVSAFPVDGTWPVGTAKWEKRNLALEIPVWDPGICIQCNQCVLVCPHAAIRAKVYDDGPLAGAPPTFKSVPYKGLEFKARAYTIQVAPEDCTGCNLCVNVCPAKDRTNPRHKAIDMHPQAPLRDAERDNYAFFLDLPDTARVDLPKVDHKTSQFLEPLFEYSGACAGCGETPYIKLLTQLFGDRALVANATGCSSIYGGNLPTTPFTTNRDGRGPAWSNSLFEDNAEFGLGMRLGVDSHARAARALVEYMAGPIGERLAARTARRRPVDGSGDPGAARAGAARCDRRSPPLATAEARRLEALADYLVKKSIWLVGGDGWAYDIGYGGLDHILASQRDVNILVLDTEVYSNTGGQQSKATPLGAVAKFASAGKTTPEEGSRSARQHVRPRLCGARGLRREDEPDRPGLSRSRGVPGDVAHHRLQPLHRARLRHGERRDAAEAGGRLGRVAALPLRPAAHRQGRAADASRLRPAETARRRVHAQRVAVPGRRAQRPRPLQRVPQGGAGSGPSALRDLPAARGHHRAAARE